MGTSGKGTAIVGYNVQTAVDAQHHLLNGSWTRRVYKRGTGPAVIINHALTGHDDRPEGIQFHRCWCDHMVVLGRVSNRHAIQEGHNIRREFLVDFYNV
jgi:hypothetical protein